MKRISILIPRGEAVMGSIEGPHKVFNQVNEFLADMGRPPLFEVKLVGLSRDEQRYENLFTVKPQLSIDEVDRTDLIIIPAIKGDLKRAIQINHDFIPWITRHYKAGTEIASLCLGAFLLASTGLLKGKKCATHWVSAHEFKKMFPDVNLVAEKIITDENGIYTCGGGYSFLNLILYVIEKHLGHEMAVLASKMFQIDIDRKTQNPFVIFMGQKRHDDPAILEAQDLIEKHPNLWITVEMICERVGMSRRTFERRFRKCTGNSVTEYIQRVKIEQAKKELEITSKTINEIIFNTGYNDVDAFRKVFKKFTDLSPLEYRRRYSSSASQFKKVV